MMVGLGQPVTLKLGPRNREELEAGRSKTVQARDVQQARLM
jgi:hypothetical protein